MYIYAIYKLHRYRYTFLKPLEFYLRNYLPNIYILVTNVWLLDMYFLESACWGSYLVLPPGKILGVLILYPCTKISVSIKWG